MPTQDDLNAAVAKLEADVTPLTSAEDGVVQTLVTVKGLYDAAVAAGGTPQEIIDRVNSVSATLEARAQTMAAAAVANTPAQAPAA